VIDARVEGRWPGTACDKHEYQQQATEQDSHSDYSKSEWFWRNWFVRVVPCPAGQLSCNLT
jgi:hypothetical protein